MSKKAFMALAEASHVSVEYRSGIRSHPRTGKLVPWEITLDAPLGKLFKGSGCHVDCCIHGVDEATPDWRKEIKVLRTILAEGFEDCTEPDCEYCKDNQP